MHSSLLKLLVDPVSKVPLGADIVECGPNGEVLSGTLRGSDGRLFPVTNGIPRFLLSSDGDQRQTGQSFGFKWRRRDLYDSPSVRAAAQQWLIQRYGFPSAEAMREFFGSRRRILDAGCGGGFSSSLWMDDGWRTSTTAQWFGVDLSDAVEVAQERLGSLTGTHFIQGDILQLPFREEAFDTVFAEGVFHHTPSTERALKALVTMLEPQGEILFYVYRKKAPIREFTDDYIRGIVSSLNPEEAWRMLRPLTRLGQALAELRAEVEVPEDIPYLGLKAGRYDVQRLMYWHFAKLFWNTSFSLEENTHVNFDWYHPRYAHRHTEDEVRRWCDESGLTVSRFHAQESGFTVRGRRAT
jgi:SAM-dependent methyltransferase